MAEEVRYFSSNFPANAIFDLALTQMTVLATLFLATDSATRNLGEASCGSEESSMLLTGRSAGGKYAARAIRAGGHEKMNRETPRPWRSAASQKIAGRCPIICKARDLA